MVHEIGPFGTHVRVFGRGGVFGNTGNNATLGTFHFTPTESHFLTGKVGERVSESKDSCNTQLHGIYYFLRALRELSHLILPHPYRAGIIIILSLY